MTRRLSFLLIALLLCGFALPETCEQRIAREKGERAWAASVERRYDLEALSSFLRRTIAERRMPDGPDLTKPRIDAKWKIVGRGMTSGEWVFSTDTSSDDFLLSFIYHTAAGDRILKLTCVRDGLREFRVVEISSEEHTILML